MTHFGVEPHNKRICDPFTQQLHDETGSPDV
jgi:hypothetical protein